MAPETRATSSEAGAKDLNSKQTIEPKLYISTRDNDSKTPKRCGHCGASISVRSKDTDTTLQDTANAAANVSAELPDSIQPAEPWESAAVLPEWNGRRRRSRLPTEEEADSRWASMSADELDAANTLVQMKNDPNWSAPVQKESRPRRNVNRQGRRS